VFPAAIDADRVAGIVTVDWDDGHRSVYTAEQLRWACPCAECQGEWGRPGRLSTVAELTADEVSLTNVYPVGSYAIAPEWESGHNSGIFSFEYLRSLCRCSQCHPS